MRVSDAIIQFLERLEAISEQHDELFDTDVRESLHLAVNHFFVWGNEESTMPSCFGMFSADGDKQVAAAFRLFVHNIAGAVDLATLEKGQRRLEEVQSGTSRTSRGRLYDEFLGHREVPLPSGPLPEHMFGAGEYEDGDD